MRTWVRHGLLSLIALAALPAVSAPAPSAKDQLATIRAELRRDKDAGDWTAYLGAARRQSALLNGSPLSVLELARAQMQLGHGDAARAEAEAFLAMGQTHPLLKTPLFASLAGLLGPALARNEIPVALGQVAIRLPDPGLVAEDVDYDPKTGRFFVSSILEHKIVAVRRDGVARTFADAPDGWPVLAVKIDGARRRLWATEVALEGFQGVASADAGRSVVLEYDLDTGARLMRLDGPAKAALGDMALSPSGEPIVADGQGGAIYRLHAGVLVRIDHGDFIAPQTPAVCPDGHVFVPDYLRGVAAFDPTTGRARWLASGGRYALAGIDGLYCRGGALLATQNGASPARVVAFRLSVRGDAIVGEQVIDRATPLTDPTHGVVVGKAFYYLGNSGWAALDDHGHVNPGAALTPAVIMAVKRPQYSTPAR